MFMSDWFIYVWRMNLVIMIFLHKWFIPMILVWKYFLWFEYKGVCGDCHSAISYISMIIESEIILRDSSRFHHFKKGSCSCQGYWWLCNYSIQLINVIYWENLTIQFWNNAIVLSITILLLHILCLSIGNTLMRMWFSICISY